MRWFPSSSGAQWPDSTSTARPVIGPDGSLIPGLLPSGEEVPVYRKNAISSYNWGGAVNDEKYYFRHGPGFPTFPTAIGRLGVLVCYDRWFSEAWRVLALEGAEVICVPNASSGAVSELFVPSIRTWSAQNVVFSGSRQPGRRGDRRRGFDALLRSQLCGVPERQVAGCRARRASPGSPRR